MRKLFLAAAFVIGLTLTAMYNPLLRSQASTVPATVSEFRSSGVVTASSPNRCTTGSTNSCYFVVERMGCNRGCSYCYNYFGGCCKTLEGPCINGDHGLYVVFRYCDDFCQTWSE